MAPTHDSRTQSVLDVFADPFSLAHIAARGAIADAAVENYGDAVKYLRSAAYDLLVDQGETAQRLTVAVGLQFPVDPYEVLTRVEWEVPAEHFWRLYGDDA